MKATGKAPQASLQVGGRLRFVQIDNNALCTVEEITGVDLIAGADASGLRILRALCYAALVSGARATGGKRDFSLEDVGDWMQESGELLETVVDLLKASKAEPDAKDPQKVQEETTGSPVGP